MSTKEEFAGRKLRCPECQRVMVIPPASAVNVAPRAAKPSSVRPKPVSAPPPTPSDAWMDITQPTLAPSNTVPVVPAERLAVPMARPAQPVAVASLAAESPMPTPAAPKINPWIDLSLIQTATPWLSGDEERLQVGVKPERERDLPLIGLWPVLVVVVLIAVLSLG